MLGMRATPALLILFLMGGFYLGAMEGPPVVNALDMVNVLNKFGAFKAVDDEGNTLYHYLAKHGALVDAEVPAAYYLKCDIDPLAENKKGETALELLAQHSYRFNGMEQKLKQLLNVLFWRFDHVAIRHQVIYKKALESAQLTHKLWQLTCTGLMVDTMQKKMKLSSVFDKYLRFNKSLNFKLSDNNL